MDGPAARPEADAQVRDRLGPLLARLGWDGKGRWVAIGILGAVSAGLMLAYGRFYEVGLLNDDAGYIVAAKSLLQGSYRHLNRVGQPPITMPLPGYPLFLAPFVLLLEPRWGALRLTTAAVAFLCALVLDRVLKGRMSPGARFVVAVLFLVNPATVQLGSQVMAEPLALLVGLAAFWALSRVLRGPDGWSGPGLGLGALIGFAGIVRPQAGAALLGIPLVLGALKYPRALAAAVAGAALVAGPALLGNAKAAGALTGYAPLIGRSLGGLASQSGGGLGQGLEYMRWLADFAIWPLALHGGSLGKWVIPPLALAFMAWGFLGLCRGRKPAEQAVPFAMAVWVLVHGVIHSLWATMDLRYVLPVLPMALVLLLAAGEGLAPRAKAWARSAAVAIVLVGYGLFHTRFLTQDTFLKRHHLSSNAYRWIRENTEASRPVLPISRDRSLWLHTGRPTLPAPSFDPDFVRFDLLSQGASHILAEGGRFLRVRGGGSPSSVAEALERMVETSPRLFLTDFRDSREGSTLYAATACPRFLEAYALYDASLGLAHAGEPGKAQTQMDQALGLCPEMPSALAHYGLLSLVTGRDLSGARRRLEQAVALSPRYVPAHVNRARMALRSGKAREAAAHLAVAERLALEDPLPESLRAAILEERRELESRGGLREPPGN